MARTLNGSRMGRTDLLILLVILLWAINISVIKIGLRSLSPHGFNAIRLGLASLAYLAVLLVRPGRFALARKGDGWKALGLGLLGITFYQVFFIKGISVMTASTASIVMGTSPIFIAMLASAIGQERISLAGWTGIAISFGGFLLVVAGENGGMVFTWEAWRGAVLILLANVCWAGYTVFSKPALERNSAFRLAAVSTIAGTVVYLPFAAGDLAKVEWARIPWQGWGAIAYAGLVAIFLCFVLWYESVKEVGSAKTGVYSNLTPILAIFFAGLVLGERLAAIQAVGAAVTLAGVYLTRSGYRFFERKGGRTAEAGEDRPAG
ncbi:MAG: DMT family transporter [Candidatus Aminicenantes bacterium]|nr:MAG: DMT family transporter [Candidatus Aminicenantes bacterium]RPJ02657.1 MAG: DMT family transporter [Candidatus Aminicenantes bacterium]